MACETALCVVRLPLVPSLHTHSDSLPTLLSLSFSLSLCVYVCLLLHSCSKSFLSFSLH